MGNAFLNKGVCQNHPKGGGGVQKPGGEFKYQFFLKKFVFESSPHFLHPPSPLRVVLTHSLIQKRISHTKILVKM